MAMHVCYRLGVDVPMQYFEGSYCDGSNVNAISHLLSFLPPVGYSYVRASADGTWLILA